MDKKSLAELDIMMEDQIPETMAFLESKNCSREHGWYAMWLYKEMTLFLDEVEKLPDFKREEWGMGTALSRATTIDLGANQQAHGYVLFVKAGPTMYDVGDDREEYMKRMNLRTFFFEADPEGDLLAARQIEINKALL